jgi:hypothetical protein
MKKTLLLALYVLLVFFLKAQSFEVTGVSENSKGFVGDIITVPATIKNTSSKAITLIIRKTETQIGSTQKSFICPDGECLNNQVEELTVRVEPGQVLQNFAIGLDAGLVQGSSRVKYAVINKYKPGEIHEFEVYFNVEERPVKNNIFSSRIITIHDVYPNPVSDYAFIEYRLLNDKVKAKIIIHNILGSELSEYELPVYETRVKLIAEEFTPGIYFYTLYLDKEGVMTRKLIVKR